LALAQTLAPGSAHLALAHARALSLQTGAKVVARRVIQLNVHRVGVFPAPLVVDVEGEMARAREKLGHLGDDAEVSIAVGSGEELATFSETVDLLFCGSRDNGIVRVSCSAAPATTSLVIAPARSSLRRLPSRSPPPPSRLTAWQRRSL
jgi:nucleotide-binding universal stress UspA family protein